MERYRSWDFAKSTNFSLFIVIDIADFTRLVDRESEAEIYNFARIIDKNAGQIISPAGLIYLFSAERMLRPVITGRYRISSA